MKDSFTNHVLIPVVTGLVLLLAGCGGKSGSESKSASGTKGSGSRNENGSGTQNASNNSEPEVPTRKPIFGTEPEVRPKSVNGSNAKPITSASAEDAIRDALKPLQIVIGTWNGVTNKVIGNFKALENPKWQWDFSQKNQPALAFVSPKSPYLRKGRLTYRTDSQKFELTATDAEGVERVYQGTFTEPVRDVPGDGKHLERTFKLTLQQIKPEPGKREPIVKIDLQQRNNNRYWLIVHRKTGSRIAKWDTVGNQRDGTAIAASLDDYGDRTCVVTQGLGTMTVSYNGKTYYVCCSGCKKTFEEDPAKWVASFEEWKKKNGKK
ncbi:MAG: hypothetical protein Tsb009_30110 [Planctomycetaceae bacterium]